MRTLVFTREDGTQALVIVYSDGHVTLAEREHMHATWGPPISPTHDDDATRAYLDRVAARQRHE